MQPERRTTGVDVAGKLAFAYCVAQRPFHHVEPLRPALQDALGQTLQFVHVFAFARQDLEHPAALRVVYDLAQHVHAAGPQARQGSAVDSSAALRIISSIGGHAVQHGGNRSPLF